MPTFLQEFASSVNGKREELRRKIFEGERNLLHDDFQQHFQRLWKPLDELSEFSLSPHDLDITAVDSSVYTNLLSTGGVFYIIRSLAVCKNKTQKRLETDVLYTKEGLNRIRYFIGRKMELLEFQAALDSLQAGFRGDAILLDGSLYGRAMHRLVESQIEEEITASLLFFQTYSELLEFCRRENVLLIGVSKESRATFYRDYLLSLIFSEKLSQLELKAADLRKLQGIFPEVLDNEKDAFKKFGTLKRVYGEKLDSIESILEELASSRPDYQVVMSFAHGIGYTSPMLLGPSARVRRFFRRVRHDPRSYVTTAFPNATRKQGEEFVAWATNIISTIPELPSITSLYVLLDPRDSPIRIDVPHWKHLLKDVDGPKPVDIDLRPLLNIMVTGYCGLEGHNLWLKDVDQKVRLKRRTVDGIYIPYLEKLFQSKVIRGRGYRRVKYP